MVSFVFGTEWNLSGRPSEENSHSTVSTSTPETRESPTKRSEFSPHLRLHPSLWLELVRSMYGQSGHGVDAPRPSGGLGMISICVTDFAPWRMEVPTQSLPVSPPPMTSTSLPFASIGGADSSPVRNLFCPSSSSRARCMPPSSRPGILRSRAAGVPIATTTASKLRDSHSAEMSRPTSMPVTNRTPSASMILRRRSISDLSSLKHGMP